MTDAGARALELAANLARVKARIAAASEENNVSEPTLIVVTKFHPAHDVRTLLDLGVRDVGENRDQEASEKAADVAEPTLRWHFIGQLQKNKAKSVVRYAHSVQSVDRATLVSALENAMKVEQDATGRANLQCLLQISLAQDGSADGRGGADPQTMMALAEQISQASGLELGGLMAVAPLGIDPRPAFERLAGYSAALVKTFPQASMISAGMSHDLEEAIAVGATHLRVGSDVLGPRPAVL